VTPWKNLSDAYVHKHVKLHHICKKMCGIAPCGQWRNWRRGKGASRPLASKMQKLSPLWLAFWYLVFFWFSVSYCFFVLFEMFLCFRQY